MTGPEDEAPAVRGTEVPVEVLVQCWVAARGLRLGTLLCTYLYWASTGAKSSCLALRSVQQQHW